MTAGEEKTRIDVILGRCDDMRAEVYVRTTGLATTDAAPVVVGTLRGPESRLAITLPTEARLTDLGPGPDGSAVARAILTEPAYWTPELPHRYRLSAQVMAGGQACASAERLVGLRRLGVRGRSFWLEGRRWVPRGVGCDAASFAPKPLRDRLAAAVIEGPAEHTCAIADEAGVGIVAICGDDPVAECLRWAPHPSVMLAVLPRSLDARGVAAIVDRIAARKGTLLVGLTAAGDQPPPPVPTSVDFLMVALDEAAVPHGSWREPPPLPLVACRMASGDLEEKRRGCDRMQADLAAWRGTAPATWDWAGYLTSNRLPSHRA